MEIAGRRSPLARASSFGSLPPLVEQNSNAAASESEAAGAAQVGEFLEPDLRDFITEIVDTFAKWSEPKRRKDTEDLVTYLEDKLSLYTVPTFYNRFSKDDEHGLDIDKLQILPCERPIKTKLVKFFVYGEPGTWRESMRPTQVDKGTNPILRPHQEEPFTYSAKSYLRGPFAIVRSAMTYDDPPKRVALKEYAPEIDVSFDILIQNLMLPHPNALRTICTYRTTRTGKAVQKMAMEPWCDYRLEDVIAAGAYGMDLVLKVGYCLGSLLYHIHCHGVKHVNINPRNILLTEEGGIYLSDLSTSRIYVEDDAGDGTVTPSLSTPIAQTPTVGVSRKNSTLFDEAQAGPGSFGGFGGFGGGGVGGGPAKSVRLAHTSSVSTMAQLTIQTDLFYTAPEQKVDVSRRGTDIWMLGVTLLELLYGLSERDEAPIRDASAYGYMVAALSTTELRKKLDSMPSITAYTSAEGDSSAADDADQRAAAAAAAESDEAVRREILDIVREILVQQPRDRPSAYEIHQRLGRFAQSLGRELQLNPDPDLPPIEAAKDVIRAKIPYSVHEHTTVKGEDDAYVDLSRGEKKVRFGNQFEVETFEIPSDPYVAEDDAELDSLTDDAGSSGGGGRGSGVADRADGASSGAALAHDDETEDEDDEEQDAAHRQAARLALLNSGKLDREGLAKLEAEDAAALAAASAEKCGTAASVTASEVQEDASSGVKKEAGDDEAGDDAAQRREARAVRRHGAQAGVSKESESITEDDVTINPTLLRAAKELQHKSADLI